MEGLSFREKNVLRLDLNEPREGFFQFQGNLIPCRGSEDRKGEGTNSGKFGKESGGREYQKQSGEYGRICKFEDSHRDKMEQCM